MGADIHIAQQQLPGGGALVKPAFVKYPPRSPGGSFLVTYTAAAGSTTARPKWRVYRSYKPDADENEDAYGEPVVDDEADLTEAPIAAGEQFEVLDVWGAIVPAGQTIKFAVEAKHRDGLPYTRLEIGEGGEPANPGTVLVKVVVA